MIDKLKKHQKLQNDIEILNVFINQLKDAGVYVDEIEIKNPGDLKTILRILGADEEFNNKIKIEKEKINKIKLENQKLKLEIEKLKAAGAADETEEKGILSEFK